MNLENILSDAPKNDKIHHAMTKCYEHISCNKDAKIMCSISGGSDSDVVLDLVHKFDINNNVDYVFFNTGLEYDATLRHLDYLEDRYGITIKRIRAKKSIPTCCHEYGLPLISKYVSGKLERAQKHNFQFEDEPYEVLNKRYPNLQDTLQWFSNCKNRLGELTSMWNIDRNPHLREFLIKYPPNSEYRANVVITQRKRYLKVA